MEGFEGDTRLKDAVFELFEFYHKVSHNELAELVALLSRPGSIADYTVEQLQDLEHFIKSEEAGYNAEVQAAQYEFLKKHNLK